MILTPWSSCHSRRSGDWISSSKLQALLSPLPATNSIKNLKNLYNFTFSIVRYNSTVKSLHDEIVYSDHEIFFPFIRNTNYAGLTINKVVPAIL